MHIFTFQLKQEIFGVLKSMYGTRAVMPEEVLVPDWHRWGDLLRKVPLPVGGAKKRNIILLTIWCILRWYIVTFDKTKQLWAYPMSKTNLHHFLFMSVTLTFWVLRPFWALKSDLASVIALQLQHFVCQTFWYIKIRNPSTNKKVIPQNVKWYRFPKGLLC